MSRNVLAISRLFSLFSTRIYKAARLFLFRESLIQSIVQSEIIECSKKAFFCGNYCDRNQAIILVVLVSL